MKKNKFILFFQKVGLRFAKFFGEIRLELKKVIWPNRKQLINNTSTVLLTCAFVGVIIVAFDFGIGQIVDKVFK
jgi:preprotein translocase subunit SecE